ncbi:hypothetical protein C1H46_021649 [Malus baccata]|uniref:Leucine-rich repeat-containing N-terminal plant-type domain-containing protein n=1 Tax=Malus baccata TaxID=106549 RepID=A0A540M1V1_MALBA|nr:hypothetical protein C1H46_021649 [Malus baccata]
MGVQIHNLSLSSLIILIISAASLQLLAESKTFWADIEALKEFKNSLNPDSVTPGSCVSSWDFTLDPCDNLFSDRFTCGFRCDPVDNSSSASRLTELTLDQAGYSGSLSSLSWNLPYLQTLDLSDNFFSGSIPDSLSNLTRLSRLASNYLITATKEETNPKREEARGKTRATLPTKAANSGTMVCGEHLSQCENRNSTDSFEKPQHSAVNLDCKSKLRGLKKTNALGIHNQLNGSIPCSISGLNALLFCQLSQNKLAGALPASLGQLPKIERLIFENNKLSGKLPAVIRHLAILTDIFFSNNRFTGKIPSSFSNLHNLQTVDLSTNRFIGQIPPQLAKLQRLDTLDLSFNPLGLISVPSFFARLKLFRLLLEKPALKGSFRVGYLSSSVSIFDLSSNSLTGKLPHRIGNMTRLSFLNLSNNGFHSSIPAEFRNLSLLMDLDLHL